MSSPQSPLTPAQADYARLLGSLPPQPAPQENPVKSAAPATPAKRRAERLSAVRQWLLEGVALPQAEVFATHLWKVSPRTARGYIRDVRQTWAAESSAEDHLAQLWMAKLQREHLADKAVRKMGDCTDVKAWMALLRVLHQMLKERDLLLGRIHAHRVRSRRDASPDSATARRQRQGLVALTAEEWQERLTHWRNLLHQQWTTRQQEQAKEGQGAD